MGSFSYFRSWNIASSRTMQLTSMRSTLLRLTLTRRESHHLPKPLMCSGYPLKILLSRHFNFEMYNDYYMYMTVSQHHVNSWMISTNSTADLLECDSGFCLMCVYLFYGEVHVEGILGGRRSYQFLLCIII